jgi:hypothetical protein
MFTTFRLLIRRTRQHHAIEHATIHLLSERFPQQHFSGYSDPMGFTLYGEVPEEAVQRAVGDALVRLQAGEKRLALHANCGTNLAVTGLLVTLAALVGGSGKRGRIERFTSALLLVLPVLLLARPLGYRVQTYTTLPEVADRWVTEIRPIQVGAINAHRILFDC